MQNRPFEEWIQGCDHRDANLCGAYARPTDKSSLVRGGEGEKRWWDGVLKESTTKNPMYVCQGDTRVGCRLRVEFLLKTDSGYPKDTGVNKPWQPLRIPFAITPISSEFYPRQNSVRAKIDPCPGHSWRRTTVDDLFGTLVNAHLLQSQWLYNDCNRCACNRCARAHCTRGLQYAKHSDRGLTESRLLVGCDTEHQ